MNYDQDPAYIRERILRHGFHAFVEEFWGLIDPTPFRDGWHCAAICDHLEAAWRRQIKRLLLNLAPRTGKSKITSVLFPAYLWALDPKHNIMNLSYDLGLVAGFAEDTIDLIKTQKYQQVFPDGAKLPRKNYAATDHENEQGGCRFSTLMSGRATGFGANTQICDDPHKAAVGGVLDPKLMLNAVDAYDGTFASRYVGDLEEFVRIITAQRVHSRDLSAHALKDLGYEALIIPLEHDPKLKAMFDRMSVLEFEDPRTEDREIIPNGLTPAGVARLKKELGGDADSNFVSAQLQQNPKPLGGAMVERDWFGLIKSAPWKRPQECRWFTMWDPSSKGNKLSHSRTAGGLFAVWRNRLYVVDIVAKHLNYPQFKDLFIAQHREDGPWAQAQLVAVEDKANGSPLLDDLGYQRDPEKKTDPKVPWAYKLKAIEPGLISKEERFRPRTSTIADGKVILLEADWNKNYLDELTAFPGGTHDDLVDITGDAIGIFHELSKNPSFLDILKNNSR